MKNTFKSMYDHIGLNDQQKNAIWEQINREDAAPKPEKHTQANLRRMALPIAAAFALVALSGTAVLAATGTFSAERMAKTLMRNSWDPCEEQKEATSEQKEIYTKYGDTLGIEIELSTGTLYLDDICYDQNFLNIPFRFVPSVELAPGSRSYDPFSSSHWFRREEDGPADDELLMRYYTETSMAWNRHIEPYVQEDGSIIGWVRPYLSNGRPFAQGDVIQFCRYQKQEIPLRLPEEGEDTTGLKLFHHDGYTFVDMYVLPEVLAEFTLTKAPAMLEISPELCTGLPEDLTIDEISLSSLSLSMDGHIAVETDNDTDALENYDRQTNKYVHIANYATIVMKDGTVISQGGNYSGGGYHFNEDDSVAEFHMHIQFQEPVNLDDAEWIHIDGSNADTSYGYDSGLKDIDLWIPIHQE